MWLRSAYRFCSIARSIYLSQNIAERIKIFQSIDLAKSDLSPLSIQNPSFLKQAKAKEILQFVKINQIPNNIRILHALTHIQYNAFMSYLDTIFRFKKEASQLQEQFLQDMREVALEEGGHFIMLRNRLRELGYDYGCMPVIPKLSYAIKDTESSLIERIGVISLMHEGRGVKAVEKLLSQLDKLGDYSSVTVVKVIQKDEHKHFQIGWKWFHLICQLKNLRVAEEIQKVNLKFKSNIVLPQIYSINYQT